MLESVGLFVDEAALTGETYPTEKSVGIKALDTPLSQRSNVLYMGTHVISGTGKAVVVKTDLTTEFGAVSQRLSLRVPENEFESGIRHFGYLLMEVTLLLVIAIICRQCLLGPSRFGLLFVFHGPGRWLAPTAFAGYY